LAVVVDII